MNALTLAELRLRQAELAHRAERLRAEWRTVAATTNRALTLGRQVKECTSRANDFARLIELAEGEDG